MPIASTCPIFALPILQGVKISKPLNITQYQNYEILRVETKKNIIKEIFSRHKPEKNLYIGKLRGYVFLKKNINTNCNNWCPYCMNKNIVCTKHEDIYSKDNILNIANEEVIKIIGHL